MKGIVPFRLYTGALQSNKVVCFNFATAIPIHYFSSACGDCSKVICCVICPWANSPFWASKFPLFCAQKKMSKSSLLAKDSPRPKPSSRHKKLYFWCSVLLTCKALRPSSSKLVSKSASLFEEIRRCSFNVHNTNVEKKSGLMDNRPFPSSKIPHFQYEAKCTAFLVKLSFICMTMKNHFHIKGWALNIVLIQRPRETRKWPCKIVITFNLKYIITHCIEWTAREIVLFLTF